MKAKLRKRKRWRFPLWLRILLVAWLSFTAMFGLFLAKAVPEKLSDTVEDRKQDKVNQEKPLKTRSARKNLVIVAHGRSGSSITGDIFNHHPNVFYMYEPLQTVQRTKQKFAADYDSLAQTFLKNLLRCSFDEPIFLEDIEWYYRRPLHPRLSHAIASPPLCPYSISDERWQYTLCPKMTNKSLGNACKHHYQLTVIKVLMSRIPYNSLRSIFAVCDFKDVDCKIVFLIRDPRAVIPSSLSVGFYREQGGVNKLGTRMFSYKLCKQTEENLEFLKSLPAWLRARVILLRYEDFARNPLNEMKRLYKFAGLSVLESVTNWLNLTTHPSKQRSNMKIQGSAAAYTVDDAETAINRWRWKVHPYEIVIIEQYCKHVMKVMGYRPVNNLYELQSNTSIPLYSQDYEAKDWFRP